jgi:hypothetical protein
MAATRTGLRRVAGVNSHHLATLGLRLVGQKLPKPGETPRVQAASGCLTTPLCAAADMSKVLHNNHSTGLDGIDDTPTQNVVAVAPETVDLPGQLAEMPLGRAGAFALETATEPEVPAFDLLPATFSKEPIVGTDGWAGNPQVHTSNIARWPKLYIWKRDGNMQPEPPFAVDQVSAVKTYSLIQDTSGMWSDSKWNFEPSCHRCKAYITVCNTKCVGTGVVPNWTQTASWLRYLSAALCAGKCITKRLAGTFPSGDHKLGRECWELLTQGVVGSMVKSDTVPLPALPAISAHGVETLRVLAESFQEGIPLFGIRSQLNPDCPTHCLYATISCERSQGGGAPPHA